MREVARLADRIVVIWGLFNGYTFDEWTRLKTPQERDAALLADQAVEVDSRHMKDGVLLEAVRGAYRPAIPQGSPLGAAWDIAAYIYDAHTYTTPSKNLEEGDVCQDGEYIRWHDDSGIRHELAKDVIISRDKTNTIDKVRRR